MTPTLLELGLLPLPPSGEPLRFAVRAGPRVGSVKLRIAPDGEEELHQLNRQGELFSLSLRPARRELHYRYVIDLTDGRRFSLNAAGLQAHEPLDRFDFTLQQLGPAWSREAIFYQVFPDRFAQGDPSLAVKDGEYVWRGTRSRLLPWEAAPLPYRESRCLDFRGGDLPGISQRLDHLGELGVNALYLTPIHPSFTNHRYDVCDYGAIDPHLGGERALSELTGALRARGMRIILDAVINHCGSGHRWFNREGRYPEPGAYQDPGAPLAEAFEITSRNPTRYVAWKGIDSLPRLNFASRKLRDTLWGQQGELRKWLRAPFEIDGYRFDVANMVGRFRAQQLHGELWRELQSALRSERDAYLVGEHWFDPDEIVGPGMLDGAIDYLGFAFPVRRFFTGRDRDGASSPLTGQALLRQLTDTHAAAQGAQNLVCVNSHDVARLQTAASLDAFLAATQLQLFWPGTPCLYYGDEVGLGGGDDPDNRRSMIWDRARWDQRAFTQLREAIARRRGSEALRRGLLVGLDAGDDWAAFARVGERELAVGVIARSRCEVRLELGSVGRAPVSFSFDGPGARVELLN